MRCRTYRCLFRSVEIASKLKLSFERSFGSCFHIQWTRPLTARWFRPHRFDRMVRRKRAVAVASMRAYRTRAWKAVTCGASRHRLRFRQFKIVFLCNMILEALPIHFTPGCIVKLLVLMCGLDHHGGLSAILRIAYMRSGVGGRH